jgi:hypothetical protein
MSGRARACAAGVIAALLILSATSGSVWGSFNASTVGAGNSIVGANDWVAPQVTMVNPGTPLRATVSLSATATDSGMGVSTVTIQRSAAGAAAWVDVCTDSSSPYNCPLDTTQLADGSYDLRAVARDTAGNSRASATVGARVIDNNGPVAVLGDIASDIRGSLTLTATATDQGTGVASVRIERSLDSDGLTFTTVCTVASAPYACPPLNTASLANDVYDFRAVATDLAGNSTTSALVIVQIDNGAPTGVAISAPASPLRGTVALTATADDPDSGIETMTLQRSKAGLGTFADICVTSLEPYSCTLTTTAGATPDGTYDLRVIAVDAAGNSTTSAIVSRVIDNSQPSVSMVDPGAFVKATVTLQANAYAGSGVTQVAIQRAPAGGSTWTTICTDPSAPYSCSWDTSAVADGLYDLRAVMTYAGGSTLTSAVMAGRRVDNAPVSGYDVQSENHVGGVAGRVEINDALVLTWSRRMNIATLLAGWDGTGTANLQVRLADGNASGIGTGSGSDALQLLTSAGAVTGLGQINLKTSMIRTKKSTYFTATATQSTVTTGGIDRTVMRVTLKSVISGAGNVRTTSATPSMVWTPSATARDVLANICSVAPLTEPGLADRDF